MKSGTAIAAVRIAVVSVTTISAVLMRQAPSPHSRSRRTIGKVMVQVSFATESSTDAVIFLTTPVQKR
jgi:hypothetical protein